MNGKFTRTISVVVLSLLNGGGYIYDLSFNLKNVRPQASYLIQSYKSTVLISQYSKVSMLLHAFIVISLFIYLIKVKQVTGSSKKIKKGRY